MFYLVFVDGVVSSVDSAKQLPDITFAQVPEQVRDITGEQVQEVGNASPAVQSNGMLITLNVNIFSVLFCFCFFGFVKNRLFFK